LYMQLHFLSFLLNIASWLILGLIIGRLIYRLKNTTGSAHRFYFTILGSALTGGLLAELANGSPEFGISIINLLVSGFAAIIAVFLAFPKYAHALTKKLRQTTVSSIKTVKIGIQVFRSK
jgi:hypothetical protein